MTSRRRESFHNQRSGEPGRLHAPLGMRALRLIAEAVEAEFLDGCADQRPDDGRRAGGNGCLHE